MESAWHTVKWIKFWDLRAIFFSLNLRMYGIKLCYKRWVVVLWHAISDSLRSGWQSTTTSYQILRGSILDRLHDLPINARNEYVGNLIGSKIWRVEEVDVEKGEIAWGEYMKIHIGFDVSKPLLKGKKISMGLADPCWVWLSYKELSNFCYYCDLLGYGYK